MDEWDDAVPSRPVYQKAFDDEEADGEGEVLDSWDAEEEEKPMEAPRPKAVAKQMIKKREEEEKKQAPQTLVQKKQLEEEQAKERDAELAADLFGTGTGRGASWGIADDVPNSIPTATPSSSAEEKKQWGTRLEDVTFFTDDEANKVAKAIEKKLTNLPANAKTSSRVLSFLKTVALGPSSTVLTVEDLSELNRAIQVKYNEALNKKKGGQKKGPAKPAAAPVAATSTGKGKVTLGRSSARNLYSDDLEHDDGDDYDFL